MDDALVRTRHVEQVYAEFLAVSLQGVKLLLCDGVSYRQGDAAGIGRCVVIDHGDGEVGAPDPPARLPQAVECLRRRHLVDQVQVDVQDRRLPLFLVHHVRVPYLLVHRLVHVAVHRMVAGFSIAYDIFDAVCMGRLRQAGATGSRAGRTCRRPSGAAGSRR